MKMIKDSKFFKLSIVNCKGKNYGVSFYLDEKARDEYLKDHPVDDTVAEVVETDSGFEEQENYRTKSGTKTLISLLGLPYSEDTVFFGNYSKEPDHQNVLSRPVRILKSFGRASLPVLVRYESDGSIKQIFIGTKRAQLKGVVKQSWSPATDEELQVIANTWPKFFQHFTK